MDRARRAELIARYRSGPAALAAALDGITAAELDARPAPGEWSPREIVQHCADGEMTGALRLRRLIAEDSPVIQGYDEGEYARRLFYDRRPIDAALALVGASRESSTEILEALDEEQWQRAGSHSELGAYSVERWLEVYAAHVEDHADQVRRARAAAGRD